MLHYGEKEKWWWASLQPPAKTCHRRSALLAQHSGAQAVSGPRLQENHTGRMRAAR